MAKGRKTSFPSPSRDKGNSPPRKRGTGQSTGKPSSTLFLEYYCLYRIASTLTKKMDIDRTIREVKKIIRESFQSRQYSLMLLDAASQDLYIRSQFGIDSLRAQQARFPLDNHSIFGVAMRRRRPVYVPDLDATAENLTFHPGGRRRKGAFLTLPLLVDGRRAVGVLNLYRDQPQSFTNQEINLLAKIAMQVGQVIDNILLYKKTRALSITDELTGIFNRRYFNQRYEQEFLRAARYQRPLSVIMIDIDHFKTFNDTHGHLLGDKILKSVVKILSGNLRKADILARFGGEEFVIVLPEINSQRGWKVAEKLRLAIEQHKFPKAESQPLGHLTVSLGLASYPEHTQQGPRLLAMADEALYEAKAGGRNQVCVAHVEDASVTSESRHAAAAFAVSG